jgi:hypothetical protein
MREETIWPVMLYVESGMLIGKEMVFCKDCRYWDKEQTQCNYRLLTEDAHMKVLADDFCSRGKRR